MIRFLIGRWNGTPGLKRYKARRAEISADIETVRVTIDGEVRDLTMPLAFTIMPKSLNVWIPRP